jgi:hypothetical protein
MAAQMKCMYKESFGFIVNTKRIKEDVGSHMEETTCTIWAQKGGWH